MTQTNKFGFETIDRSSLVKAMVIGGGIAMVIILFLIVGAESRPEWPEYWRIRPLIITPLAGALGGACFYVANQFFQSYGLNRSLSLIITSLGFIIALWLGTVLGLDGTMWN